MIILNRRIIFRPISIEPKRFLKSGTLADKNTHVIFERTLHSFKIEQS